MRSEQEIRADHESLASYGALPAGVPYAYLRLVADVPDLLAALAEAEARAERSWEMVLQQEARAFRAESALAQLREQIAALQAALGLAVEAFTEHNETRSHLRTDWVGATVVNAWRVLLSSPSTVTPPETDEQAVQSHE